MTKEQLLNLLSTRANECKRRRFALQLNGYEEKGLKQHEEVYRDLLSLIPSIAKPKKILNLLIEMYATVRIYGHQELNEFNNIITTYYMEIND